MTGIPPDSGQSELTLHTAVVGPKAAGRHASLERPKKSGAGQRQLSSTFRSRWKQLSLLNQNQMASGIAGAVHSQPNPGAKKESRSLQFYSGVHTVGVVFANPSRDHPE
jgi:hypothetical protein